MTILKDSIPEFLYTDKLSQDERRLLLELATYELRGRYILIPSQLFFWLSLLCFLGNAGFLMAEGWDQIPTIGRFLFFSSFAYLVFVFCFHDRIFEMFNYLRSENEVEVAKRENLKPFADRIKFARE